MVLMGTIFLRSTTLKCFIDLLNPKYGGCKQTGQQSIDQVKHAHTHFFPEGSGSIFISFFN